MFGHRLRFGVFLTGEMLTDSDSSVCVNTDDTHFGSDVFLVAELLSDSDFIVWVDTDDTHFGISWVCVEMTLRLVEF